MDKTFQEIINRLGKADGDTRVLTDEERDFFLNMVARAREGIEYLPEYDIVIFLN